MKLSAHSHCRKRSALPSAPDGVGKRLVRKELMSCSTRERVAFQSAAQRAVDAGIKVVAFDVNVENDKIPQIEQSDRDLARLVLEQAISDNGDRWKAGYVHVAGIAPLDRRDETWRMFQGEISRH